MAEQRIVMIDSECHISVDTGRLLFKRPDGVSKTELASDMALLCLHHERISITHHALRLLNEAHCGLLTTNAQHMPCGLMLGLAEQTSTAPARLRQQILLDGMPEQQGRLWQQIIQQKINNGIFALQTLKLNGVQRMIKIAEQVELGDNKNAEAQAAAHFWRMWFAQWPDTEGLSQDPDGVPVAESHQSDPDNDNDSRDDKSETSASIQTVDFKKHRHKKGAADALNIRLNYAYAILRAMIAREICASGLNPILAVGHRSVRNSYNLADDLIEPYRFLADIAVASLPRQHFEVAFKGVAKQQLLQTLHYEIMVTGSPMQWRLAQAIHQTVKSYTQAIESLALSPKTRVQLKLPYALVKPQSDQDS